MSDTSNSNDQGAIKSDLDQLEQKLGALIDEFENKRGAQVMVVTRYRQVAPKYSRSKCGTVQLSYIEFGLRGADRMINDFTYNAASKHEFVMSE